MTITAAFSGLLFKKTAKASSKAMQSKPLLPPKKHQRPKAKTKKQTKSSPQKNPNQPKKTPPKPKQMKKHPHNKNQER